MPSSTVEGEAASNPLVAGFGGLGPSQVAGFGREPGGIGGGGLQLTRLEEEVGDAGFGGEIVVSTRLGWLEPGEPIGVGSFGSEIALTHVQFFFSAENQRGGENAIGWVEELTNRTTQDGKRNLTVLLGWSQWGGT